MDTNTAFNFNPFLRKLLDEISRLAGPICLAGGGLRDCLLNLPVPPELDVLVSLPLEVIRHRLTLAGYQNLVVGNKHNSLLLHLNREEPPRSLSITTLRHRPSHRATLEEDLLHRDITVNAMAYPWPNGPLVDPLHGLEDLRQRRIRLVDGANTLAADPLRAVRFYRFILQLQGSPDPLDLALVDAQSLDQVSEERIRGELDKVLAFPLTDEFSRNWFLKMMDGPLGMEMMPDLHPLRQVAADPGYQETVWDVMVRMIWHVPPPEEGEEVSLVDLRWCALLHEIGRKSRPNRGDIPTAHGHHIDETLRLSESLMEAYGFSKRRLRRILNILPHLDFDLFATDRALRRLIQNKVPLEGLFRLLKAKRDASSHLNDEERLKLAEKYRRAMRRCQVLRQALHRFNASDLVLSGGDILEMVRMRPGPWMGRLQNHLVNWVTEDPTRNRRDQMEKQIWEWIGNNNLFASEVP